MTDAIAQKITIHPLAIPFRRTVRHAAHERSVSDSVIVAVELRDGTIGYGETLPRPYVTGETADSVVATVQSVYVDVLTTFHASSLAGALEAIDALPWQGKTGQPIPAARAAIELALLDAVLRRYDRGMDAVVQWMGLPGFGAPGSIEQVRCSGVIATESATRAMRQLRLMYWCGLRDFKLKVGFDGDQDVLEQTTRYLRKSIARGHASLRLDANGAWTLAQAIGRLSTMDPAMIASVEQPMPRSLDAELPRLRESVRVPIMHDESLITIDDARRLIDQKIAEGFNVRISKCGGLMPALRIAALARRYLVKLQLGCMVGETSILAAAGIRFLQVCPGVSWVEGCFGKFLLRDDVVRRSLRFGFGGRLPKLAGAGLGVTVDPARLTRVCSGEPIKIPL